MGVEGKKLCSSQNIREEHGNKLIYVRLLSAARCVQWFNTLLNTKPPKLKH